MSVIITIFLIILIIIGGSVLFIRIFTPKSPINSEDKLNQKALIKLGALNGLHNYNSKTCEWIDNLLIKGIKSGIKSHNNNDTFNTIITFNNDMVFRFWDVNQYYGWLQKGMFTYYDEEKNEDVVIEYNEEQPSPYVMLKFKNLINHFNSIENITSSNARIIRTKRKENV